MAARKGINIGSFPVILVSTILVVVALGIGINFVYSLAGDISSSGDRGELNKLGERTQGKCDSVLNDVSTEPLEFEVRFNKLESIEVNSEEEGYVYEATFPDGKPVRYKIEGCQVELSNNLGPGIWTITVSEKTGSSDTLEVEAVEQ